MALLRKFLELCLAEEGANGEETCRGVMTYAVLNGGVWLIKKLSGGRIVPPEEDLKEYWSCMVHTTPLRYLPLTLHPRRSRVQPQPILAHPPLSGRETILAQTDRQRFRTAATAWHAKTYLKPQHIYTLVIYGVYRFDHPLPYRELVKIIRFM